MSPVKHLLEYFAVGRFNLIDWLALCFFYVLIEAKMPFLACGVLIAGFFVSLWAERKAGA